MNLYLCSQSSNTNYDTYDSFVCVAETSEEAMNTTPNAYDFGEQYGTWCDSPDLVTVQYIGVAFKGMKKGIVCASFNTG